METDSGRGSPYSCIICGDALEELAKMPDECVDMIFADPPFNVGKAYQDSRDNYQEWCAEWIAECFRVLKDTGSFYLMTIIEHLPWKFPIMEKLGKCVDMIIWKKSSLIASGVYGREYQPILLYARTDKYFYNRDAQRIIRNSVIPGKSKGERYGRVGDIWDDIPYVSGGCIQHKEAILIEGTNKKAHPCQMPIALPARAIMFSTNEGDTVLDPFCGSGTTAIAAIRTKRHYIGIELEEKFVTLTRQRIAKEMEQPQLPL